MPLSQKVLLVVGILAMTMVGWMLMLWSPMPHGLAAPHMRVEELAAQGNCVRCHSDDGLVAGCLSCHNEIRQQLDSKDGYHAHLLAGREITCDGCHSEHAGQDFRLVSERSWGAQVPKLFQHPHTKFALEGRHGRLSCEECHEDMRESKLTLAGFPATPRPTTFLGLTQDCRACHSDIHTAGLTPECGSCHGQESFNPPVHFDHGLHFPLIGGHRSLACNGCHILPVAGSQSLTSAKPRELPFPFNEVRGKLCVHCHEKPHHADGLTACEDCHQPELTHWSLAAEHVGPSQHAFTGFRLLGAHEQVDCEKCHPRELSFRERYRDPTAAGYLRTEDTCEGCHADVHMGQFLGTEKKCLGCHERHSFRPSRIGQEAHATHYPLLGAHAGVPCTGCHLEDQALGARKFVGTSTACKACHEYPHGAQFAAEIADADCTVCHSASTEMFQIRPFDHARITGYPLLFAHGQALCNDCHVESPEGPDGKLVRQYRGRDTECGSCHKDVHRGQFRPEDGKPCSVCHKSFEAWTINAFSHNTMSRFHLEGAHAEAKCSRCHPRVHLPDGGEVIQYKPISVNCQDCHDIVPK